MSGTGGFQTQVYPASASAVAGDFASQNPWFSYDAGPGGLVAGDGGVNIGLFAWVYPPVDPNGTGKIVQNYGSGPVAGFVHRAQQGLITTYLANSGVNIPEGFQMGLMIGGDFWVMNDGAADAQVGQKAYANFSDGKVSFAATASASSTGTSTSSSIAPAAATSVTGSIQGDVLTVSAVGSGLLVAGATLSGTGGGGVATGTKIVSQITPLLAGEALGGIGRYFVSIPEQTVTSTTITAAYGVLTIGGSITGDFSVGDTVTGTGVAAGTRITQLGTGTGGAGTYYVDPTQTMSASAVAATGNVETKWYAVSAGLAGELVKISDHPPG